MTGPVHFAVIARRIVAALKPKEHHMPQQHDHYAALITDHGKDNDYEDMALDALALADDASEDVDRIAGATAAVALAVLHLARTLGAHKPDVSPFAADRHPFKAGDPAGFYCTCGLPPKHPRHQSAA